MQEIILEGFKPEVTLESAMKICRVAPDSEQAELIADLHSRMMEVARPKALLGVAPVEKVDDETVIIAGVTIRSRLVRVNLDTVNRVIPYVATCGTEVDAWAAGLDDFLEQYYADEIKKLLLGEAMRRLRTEVRRRFFPEGPLSAMNPGSLKEWPLTAQKDLFSMFESVTGSIGVRLTDSMLMLPSKSVSGMFFGAKEGYENCQLCPLLDCPNRRAPYDAQLYKKQYER
nr:vitamin B12 dependent-methionine synthase activation domain-containing protein [bacterium]